MSAFLAMTRRTLGESRWMLGVESVALFGLSWLSVFITSRTEVAMRKAAGSGGGMRLAFRGIGESAQTVGSVAFEVLWWNHPFILLNVLVWAIARGSIAVAGEIERGTLDLVLSRPVSRASYLASQVLVAAFGLAAMASALVAGNLLASRFHTVETPPSLAALARPALNLAALGLAVYGFTLLLSALDYVRWRPNLIASIATLASFILFVIANVPVLKEWKWLEKGSIFRAYDPVAAAVHGRGLGFNVTLLAGIGLAGIAPALLAFARRDLPPNG